MPPRSYIIAVVVLGALVGVSFFLNLGFSMTAWFWICAIAACILGVAGAFNIAEGLGSPRWIAVGLASPGLVWIFDNLHEWVQPTPGTSIRYAVYAAYFAMLAAGAGALKLVETMSRSRPAFRIGYALLAIMALWIAIGFMASTLEWRFFQSPYYSIASRTLFAAGMTVEYGSFIAAAILITIRHDVERWSCVAISLASAFLLYKRVYLLIMLRPPENVYFVYWLQPVLVLIGAAAVWRMGVILRGQASLKPLAHPSPA